MPVFTTESGLRLAESNAIVRYIGKTYRGINGELLYPDNSQPELMQRIDSILEWSSDFLNTYGPFTVKTNPMYYKRDELTKDFLDTKLNQMLTLLQNLKKKRSIYLCADYITLADLVTWNHFWKICFNE